MRVDDVGKVMVEGCSGRVDVTSLACGEQDFRQDKDSEKWHMHG